MKNTKIEWAHHTVNFWWGCTKVSPACAFCYAEAMARIWRQNEVQWGPGGGRWLRHEKAGRDLHALAKAAHKAGRRERVFINSMSDTFEDHPALTEAREHLFTRLEEVGHALDCLLLTKRPENVLRMVPAVWLLDWPAHVWIGTTVESQKYADERIPLLLDIPAKVRFLSMEPLLGEVRPALKCTRDTNGDGNCDRHPDGCPRIHQVIVGGESGPHARPMHIDWVRSIRDQCKAAGVAFFFKQFGEWLPCHRGDGQIWCETPVGARSPKNPDLWEWSDGRGFSARVGKHAAGRLLDGVEHNGFPGGAS